MLTKENESIIDQALNLIRENMVTYSLSFTSPTKVKNFCTLRLSHESREHFLVLYLNNQHQLISDEILFSGTIDSCSVYPRELVKRALELDANAIILCHNHPSGITTPSQADHTITSQIKNCLDLFSIRLLDHIIVGHDTYSFAENGDI